MTVKLKVAEILKENIDENIVKINRSLMERIGIRPSDTVEIKGRKKTIAMAFDDFLDDIGLNVIKIGSGVSKSAEAKIGETVKIKKAKVKEAKKVVIAPLNRNIIINVSEKYLRKRLMGCTLIKEDTITLGESEKNVLSKMLDMPNPDLRFTVLSTNPAGPVIVKESTRLICKNTGKKTQAEEFISNFMVSFKEQIDKAKTKKELEKIKKDICKVKVNVAKQVLKFLEKVKKQNIKEADRKIGKLRKGKKGKR